MTIRRAPLAAAPVFLFRTLPISREGAAVYTCCGGREARAHSDKSFPNAPENCLNSYVLSRKTLKDQSPILLDRRLVEFSIWNEFWPLERFLRAKSARERLPPKWRPVRRWKRVKNRSLESFHGSMKQGKSLKDPAAVRRPTPEARHCPAGAWPRAARRRASPRRSARCARRDRTARNRRAGD